MNFFLKLAVISLFYMVSEVTFANSPATLASFKLWSGTYGDTTIRLTAVEPNIINPDNCSDGDSYMVSTVISQKAQDRIYSVLMAASLSGRKVQVFLNGCEQNRPSINTAILLRSID